MGMNRFANCTRQSFECSECGRTKCDRCGRCKRRCPTNIPGEWTIECPSLRCRIMKLLTGGA